MKTVKDITVLYVEDEELLRDEVVSYLQRRVKMVWAAQDGVEGLKMYQEHHPDIIITDLRMPKMSGLKLIEYIRKEDIITPIIVSTALSDQETIVETVDLNVDQYIIKPIDTQLLNQSIYKMLQRINRFDHDYNDAYCCFDYNTITKAAVTLQKEFAKLIKVVTGKGPRKVLVLIKSNIVQVQVFSARTKYEKSLLNFAELSKIVDLLRGEFYKSHQRIFTGLIEQVLECKIELSNIDIDLKLDIDQLEFKIKV